MQIIKKHPGRFIAVVCAVLIVLGVLWYTRPMTLEQLCPEIKLDECQGITGYYTTPLGHPDTEIFMLSPEDPAFSSLMEQVRDRTFRRSLLGLLSKGARTHAGGGFTWDLYFDFEDVPLSDGSINSGSLLQIHNFYGTVDLSFFGSTMRQVSTTEKSRWAEEVLQIISAQNG